MSLRFTIIGDGGMGTVCAVMLADNRYGVRIWSAFADQADELSAHRENRRFLPGCMLPESIEITSDDSLAFDDTDIIISAVPTQYMRSVWTRLKGHCPPGIPICSVAKGIENGTLQRPTEILLDVLGDTSRSIAALSGPSIAPEIAEKLPATVVVASDSAEFAATIQRCLARPYFRVYTSPDLIGVELAGAMKNVIAIAAGIVDGLGFGNNAKAALLTRGLVEISRLGLAVGARAETFAGLAGMGDLVTTCFSPVGRNRSFGEAIGSGKTLEQALGETPAVVEGVPTTRSVVELVGKLRKLARKLDVEMPITQGIYQVLFEDKPAKEAIAELMARPLRAEAESV